MPRTTAYGLLDLVTLAGQLLAPFVDVLRAEFGGKAIDRPRPAPQPEPTPAPVPTPDHVAEPAVVDAVVQVVLHPVAVDLVAVESTGIPAVIGIPTTVRPKAVIPASPVEAGIPASNPTTCVAPGATQIDPLFVAVGQGRGRRYRPADEQNPPGQRFRRMVTNGRVKYELAR